MNTRKMNTAMAPGTEISRPSGVPRMDPAMPPAFHSASKSSVTAGEPLASEAMDEPESVMISSPMPMRLFAVTASG